MASSRIKIHGAELRQTQFCITPPLKGTLVSAFMLLFSSLGLAVTYIWINTEYGWSLALIWILCALLVVPIVIRLSRNCFDLFEALIWVVMFYGWCYILRPAYMIVTDADHMYLTLDKAKLGTLLALALGYAMLGIIAFFTGYRSRFGKHAARRLPYPAPLWDTRAAYVVVLLYTLVGAVASIIYLNVNGGLIFYVAHINWFRGESLNIRLAFLQWGFKLFPIASYIWLLTIFRSHCSSAFTKLLLTVYIVSSTIILMILGGRSGVIGYWLTIALLYHYGKRPLRLLHILLALSLVVFFVVIAGQFRSQLSSMPDQPNYISPMAFPKASLSVKSTLDDFLGSPDSDAMDVFIGLLRGIPDEFPLQYGRQFVEFFKALVPAGLLPVAREQFRVYLLGEQIRDIFWPWYGGGTPPSILGFWYLNFHIIGVVVGMFIFGIFVKMTYSYLLQNRQNKGVILLYSLTLFSFITGLIRSGDFVQAGQVYILQLWFVLIALGLITHGRFRRRSL